MSDFISRILLIVMLLAGLALIAFGHAPNAIALGDDNPQRFHCIEPDFAH